MKRVVLLLLLCPVCLSAAILDINGNVDEWGNIYIEEELREVDAVNLDWSIKGKYFDFENELDRWNVDINNISIVGAEYKLEKTNNGINIKLSDINTANDIKISYQISAMEARGSDDEIYLELLPDLDILIDKVSLSCSFPTSNGIKEIYVLSTSDSSLTALDYDESGNVSAIFESVSSPIVFRALFNSGYFIGQNHIQANSLLLLIVLAILALLILFSVIFFRLRYSRKDLTGVAKNDKTPDCSPFLASLYSGYFPNIEEAFTSFLLYWQANGIIDIKVEKREFTLTILKPLPENTAKGEKLLFQHIFGKSLTVSSSELVERGKIIKEDILSYGDYSVSPQALSDKKVMRVRNIIIAITGVFSIFAGFLASYAHFGLLTFVSLFCTVALYVISLILSSSYYREKENLEFFGKIKFFAFPLVCYLFFSGYYGYAFSVFSSSIVGVVAAIFLAVGIFSGAFLVFGINRLDMAMEDLVASSISYKKFLEEAESVPDDSPCYCVAYGLNNRIKDLTLLIILKQCSARAGIVGKRGKSSSGFGFFVRNRNY